jgi:hypothetical protein
LHEDSGGTANRSREEREAAEAKGKERETEMIKKYMKARLKEVSTWKGIISIACGIGLINFTDVQADAVAAAMVAVYAAISTFLPDKVDGAAN